MNKQGFTLVEVLVTLSVIGILSVIVLTNVNTSREKAKFTAVVSQMKTIELAGRIDEVARDEWAPDTLWSAAPAFVPKDLPEWPTPPCSGYYYDWENWAGGDDIRISMRDTSANVVLERCIYQAPTIICNDLLELADQRLVCG